MKTTRSQVVLFVLGTAPFAVTACDLMKKRSDAADAAPAATSAAATTAPPDTAVPALTPSTVAPGPHGGGGGVRPRLPDGGVGPLTFPEGGLPPFPSGLVIPSSLPSGFPPIPSGFPPIPSGFPTVFPSTLPPWPTPPTPSRR